MIYSRFATDRTIDHGQQGGRHLHQRNPTQNGRCGIPSDIPDDATTACHQYITSFDPVLQEMIVDVHQGGHVFGGFAAAQEQKRCVFAACDAECFRLGRELGICHNMHPTV
jgi:hypothetical protein